MLASASHMDESVQSQTANSLDFDNYLKSQGVPKAKKKQVDRINVSQLVTAECNVGIDEISRSFKVRSSLCTSMISRHEQQVSHCAVNQMTYFIIDLNTKAQLASIIFQNELSFPPACRSVSVRQCIQATLDYLQ